MRIEINESNKDAIMSQIQSKRNGREKQHLLTWQDILDAKQIAQNRCDKMLKKHCKGFAFYYSLNHKKRSSYKYKYQADILEIIWHKNKWHFKDMRRSEFWPKSHNTSCFYWNITNFDELQKRKCEVMNYLFDCFMEG